MDPAVNNTHTENGHDAASDFVDSIISALPGTGPIQKSRAAHRQWYESLPMEDQMKVRDRLREEIARVRAQFGKRTNGVSASPTRFREHG